MKSDSELLQEFSAQRSQDAFAQLVGRHVDLVYSAALRQVNGDVHLARDVAQQVFIDLARKAKPLSARESLVGWLYTSAHHAAANAVRSERRRRSHEQESRAMQQIDQQENNRPDWERLRPVLDAAMLELDDTDRDAVLRRFFSGESFAAIGDALELSHDAARKRVDRALDRLHGLLARRGVTSSASALGLALSQHAVAASPVGLSAIVTQAAFSGSGLLAAGSLFIMNKISVGLTAAVAAGLGAFLVVDRQAQARLERGLALQRIEVSALQESASRGESELIELQTSLEELSRLTSAEKTSSPAEPEPPVTSTERLGLDSSYAPMFRRLRLDRENLAALKDLMARRQRGDREIQAAAKLQGVDLEKFNVPEWTILRLIAARDVDERIRALLGDAGLEYVQTYERTLPHRAAFQVLDQILATYDASLSPEQSDQLVAWTAAEFDHDARLTTIPDSVVTKAALILTPLQLEKLKLVQASRSASAQVIAMNQAAAEKGKLRLTPQSAQAYAERALKSGTAPIDAASKP
ncbi:MAG: sigma-70 family RNA polymerase sigma factor [Opitutaceae bacterium]